MDQEDPRVTRSRQALIDAAIELLDEYEPEEISVTQITQRAGVGRPTFYQHAPDMPTLFANAAITRLASTSVSEAMSGADEVSANAQALVNAVYEHRDFYRKALLGPSSGEAFRMIVDYTVSRLRAHSLKPVIEDSVGIDPEDRYQSIGASTVWLIAQWLREGGEDPDKVAERIARLTVMIATAPAVYPSSS